MGEKKLDVQSSLQSIMDTLRGLTSNLSKLSVESEITDPGHDEAWKLNMKRMYDEYQHESLETIRQARLLSNQTIQNSITTADMTAKQAVRHADLAIDRQWNVDEQGYTAQKILAAIQDPTIIAAMVTAVSEAMLNKK